MKHRLAIVALFVVAALYDGLLGLAFLFAPETVFRWYDVTPPNHFGYVQFPAALLIIFGVMFAAIAINPSRNRNLIPYGVLLKLSYCGVVFYYWIAFSIPRMWKPFALLDLAFLVLFGWSWLALGRFGLVPDRRNP